MKHISHALAALAICADLQAQVTERVSTGSSGQQGAFPAQFSLPSTSVISSDGRLVAFSTATAFAAGDTNGVWDVFVHDRLAATTECMSINLSGVPGNDISGVYGIAMSADGRFVAFESRASDLVAGDTNGARDIFVRDQVSGTTELVSMSTAGVGGNANSLRPAISADGRFVVFASDATNLVASDTNGQLDVFIRDRLSYTTERVSVSSSGAQGDSYSEYSCVSADGRLVAFESNSTNLVLGDTNGSLDVFVHDRQTATTVIASVATTGALANGHSNLPHLSADGRYVSFTSLASNLVQGDGNGSWDIFVRDLQLGTTVRASVGNGGLEGIGSSHFSSISSDGRLVAFTTTAANFIPGGLHGYTFVRDLRLGTTTLACAASDGSLPNSGCLLGSMSPDGRYLAFESTASNLVPGDTNGVYDVFIHDRFAAGFASLCDAGAGNVIDCPCGNTPSSTGRGCDNSSGTGGASLTASGVAYLSTDSLAFTASGERANATSILLEGDAFVPAGLVFGQGVRCAGGLLKRLYARNAVGGAVTMPELGLGDPTVSTRSAQLGLAIQPGQARYFLVYYRDPLVLGGCPSASTFNATQTGAVTYWP